MAKRKQADRAAQAAEFFEEARSNPYVARLIEDEALRESIRDAFSSGRHAYGRLTNGKSPTKVVMEDKRFQRDVKHAAASIRDAQDALRHGPRKRRRGFGRILMLAIVGGVIAVVASEGVRSKILDTLFGKEEEFSYTPTAPATPAPQPVAST